MAYTGSKYIEDDYLNISRNLIKGTQHRHIIGAVPAMSQNESGTIWDINDTQYPWQAFDTASVLNIPAVNVADNGRSIKIFGLDENYNEVIETLVVSNTTTTTGTQLFKRVFQAYYSNGSYNSVAAGNIDIRVGTTIVARIRLGTSQTLMAVYTIPAGYNGYLLQGTMTCQSGADATGNFLYRVITPDDNHFREGHTFEVTGGGEYFYKFACAFQLPPKADIDVIAVVRSNNARITAAYDLVLIDVRNDRGVR